MKRLPLILGFLVAFSGCDVTPENYKSEPNIHAVLSTDSLHALVMVGKTIGLRDTIKIDTVIDTFWYDDSTFFYVDTFLFAPWNGVAGLDVFLRNGAKTVLLEEIKDPVVYYYASSVAFNPGESWELEVSYPDGGKITAKTTFPGEFEIISPGNDIIFYYDTLTWTRPQGAKGYTISVLEWWTEWSDDTFYVDSFFETFPYILLPADSCSITLEKLFYFGSFKESLSYQDSMAFLVSALDTNAYDYLYCMNFNYLYPFYGDSDDISKYMHIKDAWGVFGSQTVARSRTYGLYF